MRFIGNRLLKHPLLESFILEKWQKVKKYFNGQAILTLIFVLSLSIMNTIKCGKELNHSEPVDPIYFLVFLIPLFLEILGFEIFLFVNEWKQWREKWMMLTVKFVAVMLAFVNIVIFGMKDYWENKEDGDWDTNHILYRHVSDNITTLLSNTL